MSGTEALYTRIQKEIVELASAINDVVGKFKELHHPLAESHDKVPKATQQLDKITEQTEAATHQMLDTVEKITQREEEIIQGLNDIRKYAENDQVGEIGSLADGLIEKANTTTNDAYTIMDTLQFQDITSQQMDHAAALLEDIEGKLHRIIGVLQGEEAAPDQEKGKAKKSRVYDPHADMLDRKRDQAEIDDLIERNK